MNLRDGNSAMWRELTTHRPLAVVVDVDGSEPCRLEPWLPGVCDALHGVLVQVVLVSEVRRAAIETMRHVVPAAWWYVEYGAWRYATSTWVGHRSRRELDELASALVDVLRTDVQLDRTTVSLTMSWPPGLTGEVAASAADLFAQWALRHTGYHLSVGPTRVEVRLRSATKKGAVAWVRQRLPDVRCVVVGLDETACTNRDVHVPQTHAPTMLTSLVEIRAISYPAGPRRPAAGF